VRLRLTPTPKSSFGKAAGHDIYGAIMRLALATRHRVERPAISMEGGTTDLWSGFAVRHPYCL